MATAVYGGGRIRTNIPAEMAYNALNDAGRQISNSQLRLSTGKRINSAADDVAGYITSRALQSRNGALNSALLAAGDAKNVTSITQDALDQIGELLTQMKQITASAQGGAVGDEEKVALAKAGFRLAQQIQFITDNTVFGGKQLLSGDFEGDWITGYTAKNDTLKINLNLKADLNDNAEFSAIGIAQNFDLNATTGNTAGSSVSAAGSAATTFAGVTGLNLMDFDQVTETNLGIFAEGTGAGQIEDTLKKLTEAITNVSKVSSYLGGVQVRLNSQEQTLTSQITNYRAAISRIEDADVAQEQMNLIRNQFLQSASLTSLAQANQSPNQFLQLLR